jgi:hypothetical protein
MKWILCIALIGCAAEAAPARRGPVVSAVGREVRVCLEGAGFRDGARVHFQREVCRHHAKQVMAQSCSDQETGTGQVVRVLDSNCALVMVSDASDVRVGDGIAVDP